MIPYYFIINIINHCRDCLQEVKHTKMAAQWNVSEVRSWLLRPDGPARAAIADENVLTSLATKLMEEEINGDILMSYIHRDDLMRELGVTLGVANKLFEAILVLWGEQEPRRLLTLEEYNRLPSEDYEDSSEDEESSEDEGIELIKWVTVYPHIEDSGEHPVQKDI